jgi:general secretion pathway protein F
MRLNARYLDMTTQAVVVRHLDAESMQDARQRIERDGHVLVELTVQKSMRPPWLRERFDLHGFCLELRALLSAGLGVVASLEALLAAERSDGGRRALRIVSARVQEGKSLASAFEAAPDVFPPLLCAAVRAGEASGELEQSVERFATYLDNRRRVRQQAISAAIYPLLVATFGMAVVAFLLVYVVPRFASAFDVTSSGVGWPTRLVMSFGTLISDHAQLVAIALILALWAIARIAADPKRRQRAAAWLGSTRPLASLSRTYFTGQLYRTVAMMLAGGSTVLDALALARSVVAAMPGNDRLELAQSMIGAGKRVADAFEAAGVTDPISYRLLAAGERSGRLAEMMGHAAGHYERRMTLFLERLGRFVEPALLMFIALVVGTIVVLMYLPIFDLASSLQ